MGLRLGADSLSSTRCPDLQFSLLCSLNRILPIRCQDHLLDGKDREKSGLSKPTGMHHLPQERHVCLPLKFFSLKGPKMPFIVNKMPPLFFEETRRASIQSKSKRMFGRTVAWSGAV